MDKNQVGMCGAYCGTCDWKERTGCKGCQYHRGEMSYGTCSVAVCCNEKGFFHCGQCPSVPCPTLQQAFDHPEHGDNGERLANLKAWANGDVTVIELGTFSKRGSR